MDSADPCQQYMSYLPVHIPTSSYDINPPTYQHHDDPSWNQQPVYADPQCQTYYQQASEVYHEEHAVRETPGNPPVAQGQLIDYPYYPPHFNQAHSHDASVTNRSYSTVHPASSAVTPPTYFTHDSPYEETSIVGTALYSQECDPQHPSAVRLRLASSGYFAQCSSSGYTYQLQPEGHGYSERFATPYQPNEHSQYLATQYPPILEPVYQPQSMEQYQNARYVEERQEYQHYPDPQQHPSHHPLSIDTSIPPYLQQPLLGQATGAHLPKEEYYDAHHYHQSQSAASKDRTGSASFPSVPIEQQWSPADCNATPVSAPGGAAYNLSSALLPYGVAVPDENALPYLPPTAQHSAPTSTYSSLAHALIMKEMKDEDGYSSSQEATSSRATGSRRDLYPGEETPQRRTSSHTVAPLLTYPPAHSRGRVRRLEHQDGEHRHSQPRQQRPSQSTPSPQNRRLSHSDIKQEGNLEPPPFLVRSSARTPVFSSSSIAAGTATAPDITAVAAQLSVPLPPSDLDSPTSHEARLRRRKSSTAVIQHYNPYMKGKGARDAQKDIKHRRASLDESSSPGVGPSSASSSSSLSSPSSTTARAAKHRQVPSSRRSQYEPPQVISVTEGSSLAMPPFLTGAGSDSSSGSSVTTASATHPASFLSHEFKAGGKHQIIKFSSPGVAEDAGSSKGGSGKSRNGEVALDATGEKKPFLACGFCRQRKIACGAGPLADAHHYGIPAGPRTCNQCFRRGLDCEFPSESRRGLRKVYDEDDEGEEDDQMEGSSTQVGPSGKKGKTKGKGKARPPVDMVPAVDDWWIRQMRENQPSP